VQTAISLILKHSYNSKLELNLKKIEHDLRLYFNLSFCA